MPIETIAQLHASLRLALQIELATIPPYLYAIYSIADRSSHAALLIRSIVAEEMLHAALVGNIMLAVGANPNFANSDLIPVFPMMLPHHEPPLELGLHPCSETLITDVFMRLEQPETADLPETAEGFLSLGQFYHSLEKGLAHLSRETDLFATPQIESQVAGNAYSPVRLDSAESGELHAVYDLATALDATEIIVHQGEGLTTSRWADPGHHELTHYYKLLQISEGTSPLGAILPLPTDPRTSHYPENLQSVSHLFNAAYRYLFRVLDHLFSAREDKESAIGDLYTLMNVVLSTTAHFLTSQVIGHGLCAAPTFELYQLDEDDPHRELIALAEQAAVLHPGLGAVVDAVGRLSV